MQRIPMAGGGTAARAARDDDGFDVFFDDPARAYRLRKFEKWPYKGTPWHEPDYACFFYYFAVKTVVESTPSMLARSVFCPAV